MRWGALLLACVGFSTLLVGIRAEQKMPPQSLRWARQMAEYCGDLASSFERLESYHRTLAIQCRQARQGKLAELHERLAREHEQVADKLREARKAYEQLAKELRR